MCGFLTLLWLVTNEKGKTGSSSRDAVSLASFFQDSYVAFVRGLEEEEEEKTR